MGRSEYVHSGSLNCSDETNFNVLVIEDLVKIAVLNVMDLESCLSCILPSIKNNLHRQKVLADKEIYQKFQC